MFPFLLIVQTLIAVAMITVILMQRSEGGGLTGGSPAGLMSARGAADFLTRATAVLATLFVLLSIVLAALAAGERTPAAIDPSLMRAPPAGAPEQRQDSPFDVVPGQQLPAPAPIPGQEQSAPPPAGEAAPAPAE